MTVGTLAPVFRAVEALAARGGPEAVVIDGRCGSGKTWLAAQLAGRWPCQVIHMDHFYLPVERRAPDWAQIPAGNMDMDRLRAEVLAPFLAGMLREYRPYDCGSGVFLPPVPLADSALLVLEGSYSHHPALAVHGALKVFLTCSRKEQERRLRLREGERFPAFLTRWIPMEERYYRGCGIPEGDALAVETDTLFASAP